MTVWEWQPGVATAALWLLTATALLVVWYQVPLHDWQRAIMLGLAPYLLVFVTLLEPAPAPRLGRGAGDRDRRHDGLPVPARLLGLGGWRRDPSPSRRGEPGVTARARAVVGRLRAAVLHARPLQPHPHPAAVALRAERAGAAGDRVAATADAARLGARATGPRRRRARPGGEPGARRPHRPSRRPLDPGGRRRGPAHAAARDGRLLPHGPGDPAASRRPPPPLSAAPGCARPLPSPASPTASSSAPRNASGSGCSSWASG